MVINCPVIDFTDQAYQELSGKLYHITQLPFGEIIGFPLTSLATGTDLSETVLIIWTSYLLLPVHISSSLYLLSDKERAHSPSPLSDVTTLSLEGVDSWTREDDFIS